MDIFLIELKAHISLGSNESMSSFNSVPTPCVLLGRDSERDWWPWPPSRVPKIDSSIRLFTNSKVLILQRDCIVSLSLSIILRNSKALILQRYWSLALFRCQRDYPHLSRFCFFCSLPGIHCILNRYSVRSLISHFLSRWFHSGRDVLLVTFFRILVYNT